MNVESSTLLAMPMGGIHAAGGPGPVALALLPDVLNPNQIKNSFTGVVWSTGPNDEPDFTGGMYWIREASQVTPLDVPASGPSRWRLRQDVQDEHGITDPTPLL